jgi:hypothetical protein
MNPQPKEDCTSPVKKSKAKLPDFEKTLTNWVKNQQKKGISITDEDLRKQAQVFSFSRSDLAVVSSTSWLEKFKRKNRLTHLADGEATLVDSSTTSLSQTPVEGSPSSSDGLVSPPASAIGATGYPDVKPEPLQEPFKNDSIDTGSTGIDPGRIMKQHKSVPDMRYPEKPRCSSMDDCIRALDDIKSFLEKNPGVAEPDDYLAIGKLMSKVKYICRNAPILLGGIQPIDMDSPRTSKRTFVDIST